MIGGIIMTETSGRKDPACKASAKPLTAAQARKIARLRRIVKKQRRGPVILPADVEIRNT